MAKLTGKQIKAEALGVLASHPEGVRWSEIKKAIIAAHPETSPNTIHGNTFNLLSTSPDIEKIARGTYILKSLEPEIEPAEVETTYQDLEGKLFSETDFYESFADYLRDELEEVNRVMPVGGSIFKGKWGTPDVVGVLRPEPSDLIKFEPEIVAAEIKIDSNASVVAFGQAVAYKLFSHKSYIVMPNTISKDDLSRLDALATIYGIGLVTFTLDRDAPDFQLKVRAVPSQPDMFYVNDMAKRLVANDRKAFNALF